MLPYNLKELRVRSIIRSNILTIIVTIFIISFAFFPNIMDFANFHQKKIYAQENNFDQINYLDYKDISHGVSIQYPSNWIKNETQDGLVFASFFSPETDSRNFYVANFFLEIDNQPSSFNLDTYVKDTIDGYKSNSALYKNFKVTESGTKYTLAGYPAYKLIATFTDPDSGIRNKLLETGIVVGSSIYYIYAVVDADEYSHYLPIINSMINSFQITNPSSNNTENLNPNHNIIAITNYFNYSNDNLGVFIKYPSNWIKNETQDGQVFASFVSPEVDAKNFYNVAFRLAIDNTHSNPDLNRYLQDTISGYKSSRDFQNFEIIESGTNYNLASQPAYKLVGIYTDPFGIKNTVIETGTKVGNSIYYIQTVVESDQYFNYLPVINDMINSFKINNAFFSDNSAGPVKNPTNTSECMNAQTSYTNGTDAQNSGVTGRSLIYTNQYYGLRFSHTDAWKVIECNNRIEVIPSLFSNTNSSSKPLAKLSIQQFNASAIDISNFIYNYVNYLNNTGAAYLGVLEHGYTLYKNVPSYKLVLQYYDNSTGSLLKELNIITIQNNDILYQFTYKANIDQYNKYVYAITKIINSIEFMYTNNPLPQTSNENTNIPPPVITGGA
jgi:hypothetical protein